MFGLMVGLGARGRGVDREEQASAMINLITSVQCSLIILINHVVDTENYNGSSPGSDCSAVLAPVRELCFRFYQDSYYVQQTAAKHQVPLFPSRGNILATLNCYQQPKTVTASR